MKDRVKIGVIGAGYWGEKVIREYLQLSKESCAAALSMVCDTRDERLSYCEKVLGISSERLSNDYTKLIASQDVDAVHICTPNDTHYRICKEALRAGKHVLLEKPMTLKAAQAYELVDIAERSAVCLQVGHIFRFTNVLKKVRELIKQGFFGEIYYLKIQWTTLMNPSPKRDIIFDLGPHPIDISNFILGLWPKKVNCKARPYRRKRQEEIAYLIMEFDGKLLVHVELSWLQPGKTRKLTIVGSKRCATIDCLGQTIEVYENGDGAMYEIGVEKNNTILTEINHFVESILGNERSNNPGPVGAKNVEILEYAKKSLLEEKTKRIPR